MDHNHSQKSHRLFFIEFLIVLFFFFIITTVCLRTFAHANQISRTEHARSHAQAMASSIAELLNTVSTAQEAAAYFPEEVCVPEADDHTLSFYYDRSFQPCAADHAMYLLKAVIIPASERTDRMTDLSVTLYPLVRTSDTPQELYSFHTVIYHQMTRREVSS